MSHTAWYLARSSGLVAWGLLATAVLWGLFLSTRLFDRAPSPKWITDMHRFLGGLAVVFTAIHIGGLVADNYVHFTTRDILVPFASPWRTTAVAGGVISMWILGAIEITSLLMRHLPRRLWRAVHMSSFVLFFVATFHALTAGTDARSQVFVLACDAMLAVVLLLILARLARSYSAGKKTARASGARTTSANSLVQL